MRPIRLWNTLKQTNNMTTEQKSKLYSAVAESFEKQISEIRELLDGKIQSASVWAGYKAFNKPLDTVLITFNQNSLGFPTYLREFFLNHIEHLEALKKQALSTVQNAQTNESTTN